MTDLGVNLALWKHENRQIVYKLAAFLVTNVFLLYSYLWTRIPMASATRLLVGVLAIGIGLNALWLVLGILNRTRQCFWTRELAEAGQLPDAVKRANCTETLLTCVVLPATGIFAWLLGLVFYLVFLA